MKNIFFRFLFMLCDGRAELNYATLCVLLSGSHNFDISIFQYFYVSLCKPWMG